MAEKSRQQRKWIRPNDRAMLFRFCGYTTWRNLRFFEPFFVLFLLLQLDFSYVQIGAFLAYEKVLTGVLESPLGAITDRWGLRRGLIGMFVLNGVAYALFGLAAATASPVPLVWAGLTLAGLGEALRTGTHKAIILDWLDGRNRAEEATGVIALTRIFSKISGGVAALAGGLLVWHYASFVPLFWASGLVCLIGAGWMVSYPPETEGEWSRRAASGSESENRAPRWSQQIRQLFASPGLFMLIVASVIFETQFKLAMTYLQPYLAASFGHHGLTVIGGIGAILIGSYYLAQGLLAGLASSFSTRLEKAFGGPESALRLVYVLAVCGMILAALGMAAGFPLVGIVALFALAALQNVRRPILVSRLSCFMDKFQRATTLSIESQARSLCFALLAIVTGLVADHAGLAATFGLLAALATLGFGLQLRSQRDDPSLEP